MRSELINSLNSLISDMTGTVNGLTLDPGHPDHRRAFARWARLRYDQVSLDQTRVGPDRDDYADSLFDAYYLMRYGFAYAFEYWVMYDALLRGYQGMERGGRKFGVASFGCGSGLDAWALAYAREKIMEDEGPFTFLPQHLLYNGYDYSRWGISASDNPRFAPVRRCFETFCIDAGKEGSGPEIDKIFTTTDRYLSKWGIYNVWLFGKILNELPPDKLNETIDNIADASKRGMLSRAEMYICISHNSSGTDKYNSGLGIAQRIVNAIDPAGDRYDIDGRVMERSPLFRAGRLAATDENADELHRIYSFSTDIFGGSPYIWNINADFRGADSIVRSLDNRGEFRTAFENGIKSVTNLPDYSYRWSTMKSAYVSLQVIKLTRRIMVL